MKDLSEPKRTKIINTCLQYQKNVYIDTLDNMVNKYNNTYHRTIKMKLVDVKPSIYIDFSKENNKERLKFKVGYHKRISRYKKILTKDYVPDWSEGLFVTTKDKNTVPWTYIIRDLNPKTGWGSI